MEVRVDKVSQLHVKECISMVVHWVDIGCAASRRGSRGRKRKNRCSKRLKSALQSKVASAFLLLRMHCGEQMILTSVFALPRLRKDRRLCYQERLLPSAVRRKNFLAEGVSLFS